MFLIAWPADTAGLTQWCLEPARDERAATERGDPDAADVRLLPTPRSQNGEDRNQNIWERPTDQPQNLENALARVPPVTALLPTPTQSDGSGGPGNSGRDGGDNLRTAVTLLPTPRATDGTKGGPNQRGSSGDLTMPSVAARLLATPTASVANGGAPQDSRGKRDLRLDIARPWGEFGPAIEQWERLTRPAPEPTEMGPRGGQRLSPNFVQWMMGLPAGHVTGIPGLSRNEQLKALGNGVVPQQAAHAISGLLADVRAVVAA